MLALLFAGLVAFAGPLTKLDASQWRIEDAFMDAAGNHLFHLRKGDHVVREAWHPATEPLMNVYSLVTFGRERGPDGLRYGFRAPLAGARERTGQVVVEPRKLRVSCEDRECTFIRLSKAATRAWMRVLNQDFATLYDQPDARDIYAVLKIPNLDEYFIIDRPRFRPTAKSFVHTGTSSNLTKVEVAVWGGLRGQADLRLVDGRRLLIDMPRGRATLYEGEAETKLLVKPYELDEVAKLGLNDEAYRAELIRSPASAPHGCEILIKSAASAL